MYRIGGQVDLHGYAVKCAKESLVLRSSRYTDEGFLGSFRHLIMRTKTTRYTTMNERHEDVYNTWPQWTTSVVAAHTSPPR
jgi:hypothetical protein